MRRKSRQETLSLGLKASSTEGREVVDGLDMMSAWRGDLLSSQDGSVLDIGCGGFLDVIG
jgi:hypothetical protein